MDVKFGVMKLYILWNVFKHTLNLKKVYSSFMAYGETGRFPLSVYIYSRMFHAWRNYSPAQEMKLFEYIHVLYWNLILNE